MIRQRVVAHGLVQGVGYRYSCEHRARELGIAGWVRNRSDGAVEAVFEGDEAAVARMVGWARTGPRHAQVTTLEVLDEEPRGETGFDIRF
jgi:acylphosphatase